MSFYWGIESTDIKRDLGNITVASCYFCCYSSILFMWLPSLGLLEDYFLAFFSSLVSLLVLEFSLHYTLYFWIHGKISGKFGFVMEHFFSIYGN